MLEQVFQKNAMLVAESASVGQLQLSDFERNLELVTRETNASIIYVHAGLPPAIDGPNELNSDTLLVYVGSAAGQCTSGGSIYERWRPAGVL